MRRELWLDRCVVKGRYRFALPSLNDRVNCEARCLESGKSIKVSCTCLSMGYQSKKHARGHRTILLFRYWILSCGKRAKFWDRLATDFLVLTFSFSSSRIVSICLSIKKKKKNRHARFSRIAINIKTNFQRYSI